MTVFGHLTKHFLFFVSSVIHNIFAVSLSDSAGLLQFEVCPLTDSSFSVSFQHPVNESLVCGEPSCYQHLINPECVNW